MLISVSIETLTFRNTLNLFLKSLLYHTDEDFTIKLSLSLTPAETCWSSTQSYADLTQKDVHEPVDLHTKQLII